MKCPKCKADLSEDSHFCSKCGTPVKGTADLSVFQTKTIQKPGISSGKTVAGKYKIIEEIGRGGMGVVYKAEDTRLDRTVALKFLSSEFIQDDEAKQRFVQEAKAAAALNHPNICTIHEIDEADDQTFIAMEYIQGQSLKQRLEDGPLAIDEAKDIATQVAEGLKEAHDKGIVHRDIKPANIMLTEKGQAKITDFGLAKLTGGADLTQASTIMGTVAYMSPEQAKGDKVDHRADIWSLGAMLYEMLSGKKPFEKDQEHALIYEILHREPDVVSFIRQDIPKYIEQVVLKALEKDPEKRYQSIESLNQELKVSPPLTFPKTECSIVVLPFEDMSPNRDNEYFSDGLTEEIITDLSQIRSLCVISRNSAMALKGTKKNTKSIGRELNVQFVLEGSVRKAGNNLRITAQLIDASADIHLWAEKYNGTLDDVFDIQEKVSRSIVEALKMKLSAEEKQSMAEHPINNVKAYECYLRAKHEIDTFTVEGLDRAIQHLEAGLKIIGESDLLYAGLGYAYWQYFNIGMQEKHLIKGLEYARIALDLNPDSSEGHFVTGNLNFFHGTPRNLKKIIFHLKRALELDPSNCEALFHLEVVYGCLGKTGAATSLLEKHLNIDPLSFYGYWISAMIFMFEGKFSQALASMTKAHQLAPGIPPMQFFLALLLAYNNRLGEANSIFDQSQKSTPDNIFSQTGIFLKYALQRKREKALQSITPQILKWCRIDFTLPWLMVLGYSLIGETEEALNWVEEGIALGGANYLFMSEYDPFIENIRGEPRFKKLMERMKHEWENFEV